MISLNELIKDPLQMKKEKEKGKTNHRKPHLESSCGGSGKVPIDLPGVYTVQWCRF